MNQNDNILNLLITIIAAPLILLKQVFFEVGNFLLFDMFQLGPYLPITF